jgi:hypothetical protein
VTLQGRKAIDKLDIFATVGKNRALDYAFPGIEVSNGILAIEFDSVVEFPCLAAFAVEGHGVTRKINCGGPAVAGYEADLPASNVDKRPRDLPTEDFYVDWAKTEFGSDVAERVAKLFARLDGGPDMGMGKKRDAYLPRPSTWVDGPGGIQPDSRPWDGVQREYAFVDELAGLRTKVRGAGNLERFDYWLNTMRYLKAVGQVNCTWGRFNAAMDKVQKEPDKDKQKQLAHETLLPVRRELVGQVEEVHKLLLATVTTTGAMGTVANWQQHLLPSLITLPGKELARILGEPLAADAIPPDTYNGPPHLIVPTVRTSLVAGEDLRLKAIVVSAQEPRDVTLCWRPLGQGTFERLPLARVARSVYSARVPAARMGENGIEYYVQASVAASAIRFPATAPVMNQTVIIVR